MNTGSPVAIGRSMAFPAQQNWFICRNLAAVIINICFKIGAIMAIETAHIQSVVKDHIPVRTERHMKCAGNFYSSVTFIGRGFEINMALVASVQELRKIKRQPWRPANWRGIKPVLRFRYYIPAHQPVFVN